MIFTRKETLSSTDQKTVLLDLNGDGVVNFLDDTPFMSVLSGGGFQIEADIDGDGYVNFLDRYDSVYWLAECVSLLNRLSVSEIVQIRGRLSEFVELAILEGPQLDDASLGAHFAFSLWQAKERYLRIIKCKRLRFHDFLNRMS